MRSAFCTIALAAVFLSISASAPLRQETPTWAKDIAPLVHSQCSTCHTEGGHGPFALETYRDIQSRRELVRQVVLSRAMPPFRFSSEFGEFCPSEPISDEQIVTFQVWLRNGMPEGEGAPDPPKAVRGFRLGRPSVVLRPSKLPEVPTEGNPVWRAVVIDPKLTRAARLRAFDFVPGEPKAVRHVLLAVASENVAQDVWATNGTLDDKASRLIGAWAPGYPAWQLPKGISMTLKPGERLIAQVLFQTTGKPEPNKFEVGLYFSMDDADREARWISREQADFKIAAFREATITTTADLERPVDLLAIVPEARFFAYVIDVNARAADGSTMNLLMTSKWNPYWNGSFVFPNPVPLDAGTTLVSNTVYENELHSPINEGNRPRLVHSGPGIDQEVCRTHYLVADRAPR